MMRLLAGLLAIAMLSVGCGRGSEQPDAAINSIQASSAATTLEIRAVLDRYVKAVNDADENILREIVGAA